MANLKLFLQNLYDKDQVEFEEELLYNLNFETLPKAYFADDGEPDTEAEFVDFENHEILDIDFDTNTIKFVAGGDWQQPVEFTVTLKEHGKFYHNEDSVIQDADYRDGLTMEQIKKMIER